MDELRRLEREVRDLQNQLNLQKNEAERTRNRLIEESRRRLDDYRKEMERALAEHDRAAQAEYERLLREYQYSVGNEAGKKLAEMDAEYKRLEESIRRSEQELKRKNREMEQAIEAIKSDISRRESGSMKEAQDYLFDAAGKYREIAAKPCEKFVPKRIGVYYGSIRDGQGLLKAGLFEAAAAVAVSARAGLERLGYTVDDKAGEWKRYYDVFRLRLGYLRERLAQERADWGEYSGRGNNPDECTTEMDYWSKGRFGGVVSVAEKLGAFDSEVERQGADEYLMRTDGASTDDLKQHIQSAEEAVNSLTEISRLCRERYSASCERAEWGERIIDFMTDEINLNWHGELSGFRETGEEESGGEVFTRYVLLQYGDASVLEDSREWLRLVFSNSSGSRIYIYILPIESGGKVRNRVILHIDYTGAEQPDYSQDMISHISEAIGLDEENQDVVGYTSDVNELKAASNRIYRETAADLERQKRRGE